MYPENIRMELYGWGILVGSDGLMERKWYEVNTFFKFSVRVAHKKGNRRKSK